SEGHPGSVRRLSGALVIAALIEVLRWQQAEYALARRAVTRRLRDIALARVPSRVFQVVPVAFVVLWDLRRVIRPWRYFALTQVPQDEKLAAKGFEMGLLLSPWLGITLRVHDG